MKYKVEAEECGSVYVNGEYQFELYKKQYRIVENVQELYDTIENYEKHFEDMSAIIKEYERREKESS
jgi:hypothetical protein